MKGKKYTDITNGKVLTVKDHFDDFAILDNNSKIKVNRLLDKRYFEEVIDPSSFFNNESLLNVLNQKIKQLPDNIIDNIKESNNISDEYDVSKSLPSNFRPAINEPAILPYDEEEEKMELMRKYNIPQNSPLNPMVDAQKQLDKFKDVLDEFENRDNPPTTTHNYQDPETHNLVQRVEINRELDYNTQESKHKVPEDPIIQMFKNVKRNTDLKITINVDNKIPRHDFIEMMEDSYNTSIIDFLAQEFTNKLFSEYDSIKETFKNEIIKSISKSSKSKNDITDDVKPSVIKKPTAKRAPRKNKNIENDRQTTD